MKAGLDFAQRNKLSWLTVVLLMSGVLGSSHALSQRHQWLDDIAQKERVIADRQRVLAEHTTAGDAASQNEPRAEQEVVAFENNLQRPWERMLNELQAAARPDMQLLRLQPEGSTSKLMIHGRADSARAFLEYVARLRENPLWRGVQPISEEEIPDGVGTSVSFQVLVEWNAQ